VLQPHVLLVNPWIHDFAAYDFWAKPLGIFVLAGILRQAGCRVTLIDCLDRFHPQSHQEPTGCRFGRGPYLKTRIPKPAGFSDVQRRFSRYGIRPEWLQADLAALDPPDLILVTSLMTYWYTGLQETIAHLRRAWPDTPLVLGGVYATLCEAHARERSGADLVVTGPGEAAVFRLLAEYAGTGPPPGFDPADLDSHPYPAFDLQQRIEYVPLLTSRGCPFNCAYCASHVIEPRRLLRSRESVLEEIRHWRETYGVCDFVLYDDAFLVDADRHALPLLEKIVSANLKVRFHTPNAVHIRAVSRDACRLMRRAGFQTLRLGLETSDFESRAAFDRKVSADEFRQAATALGASGFERGQVGAYLLVGLPGQSFESIAASVKTVKAAGITPIPAYYSPIPGTALWPQAVAASRYQLAADPIFTNNAVLPCRAEPFSWEYITRIKQLANACA